MKYLYYLQLLAFVATITSNFVILMFLFPAWRQTKQRGFLFWAFAALGAMYNSISMRAFGSDKTKPAFYQFFHYSYNVVYVIDAILFAIGAICIIQSYLRLYETSLPKRCELASSE